MRGSTALPSRPRRLVARFDATERWVHWVHAVGFTGMFASGLVLYLPSLSASIGRPAAKAVHLGVALGWMTVLAIVALAGDREAIRRTRQDLESFTPDDGRWLKGKKAPQGRFNAGQKVHAVVQSAMAVLFVGSGVVLWLGERNTAFRLPGTVGLHDTAMFVSGVLVVGHLFLALVWPATRPALRGIVRGTVRADWAARHHAAWDPDAPPRRPLPPVRAIARGPKRVGVALLVLLGLGGSAALVRNATGEDPATAVALAAPAPDVASVTPPASNPADLVEQAERLDADGRLDEALDLYARAIDVLPRDAALRTSFGFALARANELPEAEQRLREAIVLGGAPAQARLYLGTVRISLDDRARGERDLRAYLATDPPAAEAQLARRLLAGG